MNYIVIEIFVLRGRVQTSLGHFQPVLKTPLGVLSRLKTKLSLTMYSLVVLARY